MHIYCLFFFHEGIGCEELEGHPPATRGQESAQSSASSIMFRGPGPLGASAAYTIAIEVGLEEPAGRDTTEQCPGP